MTSTPSLQPDSLAADSPGTFALALRGAESTGDSERLKGLLKALVSRGTPDSLALVLDFMLRPDHDGVPPKRAQFFLTLLGDLDCPEVGRVAALKIRQQLDSGRDTWDDLHGYVCLASIGQTTDGEQLLREMLDATPTSPPVVRRLAVVGLLRFPTPETLDYLLARDALWTIDYPSADGFMAPEVTAHARQLALDASTSSDVRQQCSRLLGLAGGDLNARALLDTWSRGHRYDAAIGLRHLQLQALSSPTTTAVRQTIVEGLLSADTRVVRLLLTGLLRNSTLRTEDILFAVSVIVTNRNDESATVLAKQVLHDSSR